MQTSSISSLKVRRRNIASSRAEHESPFIGFTFDGNTEVAVLAGFYGLIIPAAEPGMTLAQYTAKACYGRPRVGCRIAVRNAELVIRDVESDRIRKVGLRLLPMKWREDGRGGYAGFRRNLQSWRMRTGRLWPDTAGVA